jgi:hypothetical protein
LRRVPTGNPPVQRRPVPGRQPDACLCLPHAGRLARRGGFGNLPLGSEH